MNIGIGNPGGLFRSQAAGKKDGVQAGQVLKATVVEVPAAEGEPVTIQTGDRTVKAYLTTPAKPGDTGYFQVQAESTHDRLVLKAVQQPSSPPGEKTSSMLQGTSVPDTPESREWAQAMRSSTAPPDIPAVQQSVRQLMDGPEGAAAKKSEQAMSRFLQTTLIAQERGLPLTPVVVRSLREAMFGPSLAELTGKLLQLLEQPEVTGSRPSVDPGARSGQNSAGPSSGDSAAGDAILALKQVQSVLNGTGQVRPVQTVMVQPPLQHASSLPDSGTVPAGAVPASGSVQGNTMANAQSNQTQTLPASSQSSAQTAAGTNVPATSTPATNGSAQSQSTQPSGGNSAPQPSGMTDGISAKSAMNVPPDAGIQRPSAGNAAPQAAGLPAGTPQTGSFSANGGNGAAPVNAATSHAQENLPLVQRPSALQDQTNAASNAQRIAGMPEFPSSSGRNGVNPPPLQQPLTELTGKPQMQTPPLPAQQPVTTGFEVSAQPAGAASSKENLIQIPDKQQIQGWFQLLGLMHEKNLHRRGMLQPPGGLPQGLNGPAGNEEVQQNLKKAMLQLLASDEADDAVKSLAEQISSQLTGQQLLLHNDRSNVSQMSFWIPVWHEGQQDQVAVHVETQSNKRGEWDADNCRIWFDLNMKQIGLTLVDVHIVQKVVQIHLHNDFEPLQQWLDSAKPDLEGRLQEMGYLLSTLKQVPYPSLRLNEDGADAGSGHSKTVSPSDPTGKPAVQPPAAYRNKPYQGVDFRA